jgi:short-subunit dehydrogenase involved in D-alanine esterification of teichoic acids
MKLTGNKALITGGNSGMDVDGNNQIVQGERS